MAANRTGSGQSAPTSPAGSSISSMTIPILVSGIGNATFDLRALAGDKPLNFYMLGSMGRRRSRSALATTIAQPDRSIVVMEGELGPAQPERAGDGPGWSRPRRSDARNLGQRTVADYRRPDTLNRDDLHDLSGGGSRCRLKK
ncbi:MAG: hypothetical protein R2849_12935 [Thermomicrobiales bacterium]